MYENKYMSYVLLSYQLVQHNTDNLVSWEELDVCIVQMTYLVWLIVFSFIQLKLRVETAKDF